MQLKTFGAVSATVLSIGAGALTQSPEYQFLALPVAVAAGVVWLILLAVFLYRNRRAWRKTVASGYFIAAAFGTAILAAAVGAYGLGLRSAQSVKVATSLVWMLPISAAEKFASADESDPARLRELLLSGALVARGTPHYGNAGDSPVTIPTAEWQSLLIADRNLSSAVSNQGPSHSYDNLEIAANPNFTLPSAPPIPRYTAYEKEQRLRAIDEIYNAIATQLQPTYADGQKLLDEIYKGHIGNDEEQRLTNYRDRAQAAFDSLNGLLKKYDYFPDIVRVTKKNTFNDVEATHGVGNLVPEIQALRQKAPNDIPWFLLRDTTMMDARNQIRRFAEYLSDTTKGLQEKRAEIEKAEVYSGQ
jgi:hypothetical protein